MKPSNLVDNEVGRIGEIHDGNLDLDIKIKYSKLHQNIETKEFSPNLALSASNKTITKPYQVVKHDVIPKGDDLSYHMEVKVEEYQVEIDTRPGINTDIGNLNKSNYEEKIIVKEVFPFEASFITKHHPRKQLFDITNSHLRQSVMSVESGNVFDDNTDVKVEEQPIKVELMEVNRWEKQYQCKQCNQVYYNAIILSEHQKGHLVQNQRKFHEENPYPCNSCDNCFRDKDQMVQHQKTHDRPHKCTHCKNSFNTERGLLLHQIIHKKENQKTFQCSHCALCFNMKHEQIQHQRMHIKSKIYRCSYCEKNYVQKKYLLNHITSTHPGMKIYKCDLCFKSFNENGELARHKKIHTGEKPYQCSHCEKYFSRKDNLLQHIKIHSREKQ